MVLWKSNSQPQTLEFWRTVFTEDSRRHGFPQENQPLHKHFTHYFVWRRYEMESVIQLLPRRWQSHQNRPDQHTSNDVKPVTNDCVARCTEREESWDVAWNRIVQRHGQADAWADDALRRGETEEIVGQHIVIFERDVVSWKPLVPIMMTAPLLWPRVTWFITAVSTLGT